MSHELLSNVKRQVGADVLQSVEKGLKARYPEILAVRQEAGKPVTVAMTHIPAEGQAGAIRKTLLLLLLQAEDGSGDQGAGKSRARFPALAKALQERGELIAIDPETFAAAGNLALLTSKIDGALERLLRQESDATCMTLPTLLPSTFAPGFSPHSIACEPSALTGRQRALSHAACLPVYPAYAGARLPRLLAVTGRATCMRRETCISWPVLTEYNVRELVLIGQPEAVAEAAAQAFERLKNRLRDWGIPVQSIAAADSFIGDGALAAQAFQSLMATKTELVIPGENGDGQLALASLNLHGTAFTRRWQITAAGEDWAESACIGAGLERTACALLSSTGGSAEAWPYDALARAGF